MTTRDLKPSEVTRALSTCADLKLFLFAATDDDTEFYVRCASREVAKDILMERVVMKRLKLQPRTIDALDTVHR